MAMTAAEASHCLSLQGEPGAGVKCQYIRELSQHRVPRTLVPSVVTSVRERCLTAYKNFSTVLKCNTRWGAEDNTQ